MLKINGETYHVLSLVPAAAGMYAVVAENEYELVVLWAHCQAYLEVDDSLIGQPGDKILGVTIVDLEHGTFTVHDAYTTNPSRDPQARIKR